MLMSFIAQVLTLGRLNPRDLLSFAGISELSCGISQVDPQTQDRLGRRVSKDVLVRGIADFSLGVVSLGGWSEGPECNATKLWHSHSPSCQNGSVTQGP